MAVGVALVLALLLSLPYALGYVLAGAEQTFTGILMNPEDSQSYFAKMLQGYNGSWLYKIPFTIEDHDPALLGGFYLLLGHLARTLGTSIAIVWNLSRFVSAVLLFITTFFFVGNFLPDKQERWTAYLIAILGSGLGWLLFLFNQPFWLGAFPVDFKMPEAHLFFSALTFPHGMLGTVLLMISFILVKRTFNSTNRRWLFAALAGLTNLAIGIVYPFLIYLVGATYGVYWLSRSVRARRVVWSEIGLLAVTMIIPLPLYIYYAYTYQVNEVFRAWSDQAVTTSPAVPHYIVAYGPLLLFAVLPLIFRDDKQSFRASSAILWSWLTAAILLIYAPINPQRRFVQGVQVPLSILAVIGLYQVFLPWLQETRTFRRLAEKPRYSADGLKRLFVVGLVALLAVSNIYVLASMSVTAAIQKPYPFFRNNDEVAVIDWLRNQGDNEGSVISAYETGSYIGAHSGSSVLVGHWAETVSWEEKLDQAKKFYKADTSDKWRKELLNQYGIDLVWHGSLERQLGDFDPESADYLRYLYGEGSVNIYRVSEEPAD